MALADYAVVMVVYVSIASNWLGAERAEKITQDQGKGDATIETESGSLSGLNLIGRLGDTFAFWDRAQKATVLIQASDLKRLELRRGPLAKTRNTR